MLLTLATTRKPATDLGYLLHKHPGRVQTFDLPFGEAHVFYPEADEGRCRAALLVEVDPVGLVRGRGDGTLSHYVNDRPYAASSLLSVALARVFGSALGGRCKEHPQLVDEVLPLEAELPTVPGGVNGESLIRRLFEPLGWRVTVDNVPREPDREDSAPSPFWRLRLEGEARLQDLLAHLYVLLPVLDNDKHYFVGDAEVDKLLKRGEGWLTDHPERELIAFRYLKHRKSLARYALARLVAEETPDPDADAREQDDTEAQVERPLRLNAVRLETVVDVLAREGASRVVDLGCGEGRLIAQLLKRRQFTEVLGVDVSLRSLERAEQRLHLERQSPRQRERVRLLHGSLTYRDTALAGYDAAAAVEVVEHLDPERLDAFERVVFAHAAPPLVVLTTPNREYNVRFENLRSGGLRHPDHRFEWTREELRTWAEGVAARHGYEVAFEPVGEVDPEVGAPTQMAVFRR